VRGFKGTDIRSVGSGNRPPPSRPMAPS